MSLKTRDFKNSFALVTGASSGLGLAFARELERNQINLVIVSRNENRLVQVAREINEKFGVRVMPLAIDLSHPSAPQVLKDELQSKHIKIQLLCNNVASGYLGEFQFEKMSDLQKMLQLNQSTMLSLCHLFLEDLASHPKSAVINVSSAAAFQPIPYMAAYAASKAFVHSFSQALHWELKEKGVYVQTLTPGVIDTEFNSKIGVDVQKMKNVKTAQEVVAMSLRGLEKEQVVVRATEGIFLQKFFANFFPSLFVLKTVSKIFKPFIGRSL